MANAYPPTLPTPPAPHSAPPRTGVSQQSRKVQDFAPESMLVVRTSEFPGRRVLWCDAVVSEVDDAAMRLVTEKWDIFGAPDVYRIDVRQGD